MRSDRILGIAMGTEVHLIDLAGLTDTFIAQQKYEPNGIWRTRRFQRDVPDGYERVIRLNDFL